MNIETLRRYCLAKPGVEEDFPFDESTLAFRVGGKIFLLTDIEAHPLEMNLKCDPDLAREWRSRYESVTPGYHMNKKHWNTVVADGSISASLMRDMIDHSYELVVAGLSKIARNSLKIPDK
jgi:predicted DNA-binding protein (MmcQ/YjbR family)